MTFTNKDYDLITKTILPELEEKLTSINKIVAEASQMGDLSENAEYDVAISEKSKVVGEIEKYKALCCMPVVPSKANNIRVGSSFKIIPRSEGYLYTLDADGNFIINDNLKIPNILTVSDTIHELKYGFISSKSALIKCLEGKESGIHTIKLPNATRTYEIQVL